MPDPHELVGVRIRQRLDQHRVDDAEDRSGRADAEREREHGSEREGGPPQQAAQRVAQIAAERVEEVVELHAAGLQSNASSRRCFRASKAISVPSIGPS